MSEAPRHFADGPAAKAVAVLVIVLSAALIAYIHRGDLFPKPVVASSNPELDACIAQRTAEVDRMVTEAVVNAAQAETFKTRAVQFCEAQFPPK